MSGRSRPAALPAPRAPAGPDGQPAAYYGRPVLKPPVWTWQVPAYLFAGGLAGAAGPLAFAARLAGNDRLARAALTSGAAAALVSPPLLIADLGRPERFHHMLRVVKPTSPLNVGSWLLAAAAPALAGAAVADRLGILPRLARGTEAAAALLGPALATYTGVLLADTAIPTWHEAGRELPALFAAGAATSAGAVACLLVPPGPADPARRLALGGAAAELGVHAAMERRLGDLGDPYRTGLAGRLTRLARRLTVAGAVTLGLAGRRRLPTAAGAALLLVGSAATRYAVVAAGGASARDPRHVVAPQRRRLAAGDGDHRP